MNALVSTTSLTVVATEVSCKTAYITQCVYMWEGGAAVIIAHHLIAYLVALIYTRNCTIKAIAVRTYTGICVQLINHI